MTYINIFIIEDIAEDAFKQGSKYVLNALKHMLAGMENKIEDELNVEIKDFIKNISK